MIESLFVASVLSLMDLKTTPFEEEAGLLDSPSVFVRACPPLFTPMTAEEQKTYDALSSEERNDLNAMHHLLSLACTAVARGVAETVLADVAYTAEGGHRICVDRKMQVADVMKAAARFNEARPEVAQTKGVTTPMYVLLVLHSISKCPGS